MNTYEVQGVHDTWIVDYERELMIPNPYKFTGKILVTVGTEKPIETRLPRSVSELLALAVHDMKKSVGEGHIIDMGLWLYKGPDSCLMCMAGAVMYQSLPEIDSNACLPHNYTPYEGLQLRALNALRTGKIRAAFEILQLPFTGEDVPVPPYTDKTVKRFYRAMSEIHSLLENHEQTLR